MLIHLQLLLVGGFLRKTLFSLLSAYFNTKGKSLMCAAQIPGCSQRTGALEMASLRINLCKNSACTKKILVCITSVPLAAACVLM